MDKTKLTGGAVGTGGGALTAQAMAQDVAVLMTQGVFGCEPLLSEICGAGDRLITAAAFLAITALGAWLGYAVTPRGGTPPSTPPAAPSV